MPFFDFDFKSLDFLAFYTYNMPERSGHMDTKYTGAKIAEARKGKGLTQNDVAEALHVSVSAVSKWERGLNYPDLALMEPLADFLDMSVSELLGLESESADAVIKNITEISEMEKEGSEKGTKRKIIILFSAMIAFLVLSWGILFLGGNDTVMYQIFRFDRTGMLTLINLLLGLFSWGIALVGVFSKKKDRWQYASILSFLLCSIALYLPTLYTDLIMRFENYGTVEDTIWGYNFASLVLIVGTVLFNLCSWLIHRGK